MREEHELHPGMEPLAFLLGVWRGEGDGEWPGAEPFRYAEELRFEYIREPYLVYRQRSWSPGDGSPIHVEMGFWRVLEDGGIDICLAHPLGVVEVAEGTVDGGVVEVASSHVGVATHGDRVTRLERRYVVASDAMTYELWMASEEVPSLRRHLRGELRRA